MTPRCGSRPAASLVCGGSGRRRQAIRCCPLASHLAAAAAASAGGPSFWPTHTAGQTRHPPAARPTAVHWRPATNRMLHRHRRHAAIGQTPRLGSSGRALKIRYPEKSSKLRFSSPEKSRSSCPNELSKKIAICSTGYRLELTAYTTLLWELISKP